MMDTLLAQVQVHHTLEDKLEVGTVENKVEEKVGMVVEHKGKKDKERQEKSIEDKVMLDCSSIEVVKGKRKREEARRKNSSQEILSRLQTWWCCTERTTCEFGVAKDITR